MRKNPGELIANKSEISELHKKEIAKHFEGSLIHIEFFRDEITNTRFHNDEFFCHKVKFLDGTAYSDKPHIELIGVQAMSGNNKNLHPSKDSNDIHYCQVYWDHEKGILTLDYYTEAIRYTKTTQLNY